MLIEIAPDATELAARLNPSPTPYAFFHTTPRPVVGPVISTVVSGTPGLIEIAQLAAIRPLPGGRALLEFDDGGSVVIEREEVQNVALQLAHASAAAMAKRHMKDEVL